MTGTRLALTCILALIVLSSCDNDPYCPKGTSWCWAQCVDLVNDKNNCGSCGNGCDPGSQVCDSGICLSSDGDGGVDIEDADNGHEDYNDLDLGVDYEDREFDDGDSTPDGDEECQQVVYRSEACIYYEGLNWFTCPVEQPPDNCNIDCFIVNKPECWEWWTNNVCGGLASQLNPEFDSENVVLIDAGWFPGPAGAAVTSVNECSGVAEIAVDICFHGLGSPKDGVIFAVTVPKGIQPEVTVGNVLCGISCEPGSCGSNYGVRIVSGCPPYEECQ